MLHEESLPSTENASVVLLNVSTSTSSEVFPSPCTSASSVCCTPEMPHASPMPSSSSSCSSPSSTHPLIPVSTADPTYPSTGYCSSKPCISPSCDSHTPTLPKICSPFSYVPLLSASSSPSVGHPSRSSSAASLSCTPPSTAKSAVSSLITLSAHTAIAPSGYALPTSWNCLCHIHTVVVLYMLFTNNTRLRIYKIICTSK